MKIHSVFSNRTINTLCLLQRVDWDGRFSSSLKKKNNQQTKQKPNPNPENLADACVGRVHSSPPWQIFMVEDHQAALTEAWQTPFFF